MLRDLKLFNNINYLTGNVKLLKPTGYFKYLQVSFHLLVCLMTGPKPLPKPAVHTI